MIWDALYIQKSIFYLGFAFRPICKVFFFLGGGFFTVRAHFNIFLIFICSGESDTVQEITDIEMVAGSWWVVRGVNCAQDDVWLGGYDW